MKLPILTIILMILLPSIAIAHVEAGMPGPVAEMELRILLEFQPTDTVARNKLAMVLYQQDKLTEAAEEFNLILKTDPDNCDALDGLGLVKFKQKEYDAAHDFFKAANKECPEDAMVYFHLGQLNAATDKPHGAENAYRYALEVNARQPASKKTRANQQKIEKSLQKLLMRR